MYVVGQYRQQGFTLMEVLVTVVVVTVGLLGLAALQLSAMKSNHSAMLRTQATVLAADLLDRIRIQPNAYVGAGTDTGELFHTAQLVSADSNVPDSFVQWRDLVASSGLPTPTSNRGDCKASVGCVDCSSDNVCGAGACLISVSWNDRRFEESSDYMRDADVRESDSIDLASTLEFRVCSKVATALRD